MNFILPFLPSLWLFCWATTAWCQTGKSPGEWNLSQPETAQLLHTAAQAFKQHASIAASVRQQGQLDGIRIWGSGSYLQQGRGANLRSRLELNFNIGGQTNHLLEVNDGRYLWSDRLIGYNRTITQIDVERVRSAQRETRTVSVKPSPQLTFHTGLATLLPALEEYFNFAPPRLELLEDLPVYLLRGRWKPRVTGIDTTTKKRMPGDGLSPGKRLPGHVPRGVHLYLGRDDLFPYRVDFCDPAGKEEVPSVETATNDTIFFRLELFNLHLSATIDGQQFVYQPDRKLEVIDATDKYLKRLGFHITQKKDPVLNR